MSIPVTEAVSDVPIPLIVAGVDEAGRGPLAGPVAAAAVILHPLRVPDGIDDSKRLTPRRRELLFDEIRSSCIAHAIAFATVEEIDRLNILHASMLAMRRAVEALSRPPDLAQVDGNRCPQGLSCRVEAIVGGDGSVASIGAASILAKVARDREMLRLDALYPAYGFAAHKGYPTKAHLEALRCCGPCAVHRRSFRPVRELLTESD